MKAEVSEVILVYKVVLLWVRFLGLWLPQLIKNRSLLNCK
jgi:hypothetical protein